MRCKQVVSFCLVTAITGWFFLCFVVLSAQADLVYVDKDATAGANNGTSWADAYISLSNALKKATGEFWIAEGTYITPTADGTEISSNRIYGGFNATESLLSQRNWTNYMTILDGGSSNRVLKKTVGGEAVLDGLTVVNGNYSSCAGLRATAGSLTVRNCIFSNNVVTTYNGGAIECSAGGVVNTFSNCVFTGNQAGDAGGGAVLLSGSGVCTNIFYTCIFYTNRAPSYSGGAIRMANCSARSLLKLSGCIFSNNWANNHAGAVFTVGRIAATDCAFFNNAAIANNGGSIFSSVDGQINTFSNCVFAGNSAVNGTYGGGACFFYASMTNRFWNCTFYTNCAPNGTAGAIRMANCSADSLLDFSGCTFSNNWAIDAGNILTAGRVVAADCAFVNNAATVNNGGAIFIEAGGMVNTFSNCVFAGNSAADSGHGGGACFFYASMTNRFWNCTFYTNRAPNGTAGAIRMANCSADSLLDFSGCTFSNNWAKDAGNIFTDGRIMAADCAFVNNAATVNNGGAIYTTAGGMQNTFTNCTFKGNSAADSYGNGGGALYLWGSGVCTNIFDTCTFHTNRAQNYNGGAIKQGNCSASSLLLLVNCVFSNNWAKFGGGAIFTEGRVMAERTDFLANSAQLNYGGAIDTRAGSVNSTFSNCSFVANTAGGATDGGGALFLWGSSANYLIQNCTFFTNRATAGYGEAIRIGNNAGTLAITNCIFWKNWSIQSWTYDIYKDAGSLKMAYCDVDTNEIYDSDMPSYGSGMINTNPLFASEVEPYDVHLKSKYGRWTGSCWIYSDPQVSPCVDAGDPLSPYSNEPDPNGGRVNIGRYGNTPEASRVFRRGTVIVLR